MPANLRQTLEKAEADLITEVKEWVMKADPDKMRDIFATLVSLEEIEDEEEDEDEEDGPHPFVTLQEFATTWAQLNNLLDQVRAADGDDTDEQEESDVQTETAASPGKASGRKGVKHRHCCEIGKHEAEAAEAAASKPSHPPPAAL